MAERIRRHRARRGDRLAARSRSRSTCRRLLAGLARPSRAVLVDCLTLWLTNLLLAERGRRRGRRPPAGRARPAPGAGRAGLERGRPGRRAHGRAQPRLRRRRPAACTSRSPRGPTCVRLIVAGLPLDLKTPAPMTRARHAPPEHAGGRRQRRRGGGRSRPDAGRAGLPLGRRQRPRLPRRRPGPARPPTPPPCASPTCSSSATRSRSTSMSSGSCASARLVAGPPARRPRLLALRPGAGRRLLRRARHRLACLPGDERADPELAALSTLPPEALRAPRPLPAAWRHRQCRAGAALRRRADRPAGRLVRAAAPAARWAVPPCPGRHRAGPLALLVFYRALLQSGDLAPIDALLDALAEAGLAATGLYLTSLKDPAGATLARRDHRPPAPRRDPQRHRLRRRRDRRCFRRRSARRGRRAGPPGDPGRQHAKPSGATALRGLGPRDLAMHVALPEVDGRIGAVAVSFKHAGERDPRHRGRPRPPPAGAPTASPIWRHWPPPGRGCAGRPAARAQRRHRARQLPDARRPARQRRRPGRAGQLRRGAAAPCARPATRSRTPRPTAPS